MAHVSSTSRRRCSRCRGGRGVEVDLSSGLVRVSGELAQGSASLLIALTDAGYPAKLVTDASTPVATSQPKTSG